MRVFLSRLGFRDSFLYVINGLLMALFFGVVRVAFIIVYYQKLYKQIDQLALLPLTAYLALFIGPNIVHLLNLVWFYKIVSGLLAVVMGASEKRSGNTQTPKAKKTN